MKAAVKHTAVDPPAYDDWPDPSPADGLQTAELVATGVHQLVLARANGAHYTSTGIYPQVPGTDAVARTDDGHFVYTGFALGGTLAERIVIPATGLIELPANTDFSQVAAGVNPGIASWLPLIARLREVQSLGTVLILGATGMAGMLAISNALDLRAERVIAVGRNETALAAAAERGAAATVRLSGDVQADTQSMADALSGHAPDVVLDFVWGAPAESVFGLFESAGLRAPDTGTSVVQIGNLAGPNAAVPAHMLRSNKITLRGSGIGSISIADVAAEVPRYVERITSGVVAVPYRTYPLSQVAVAWQKAGEPGDRVVVVPD